MLSPYPGWSELGFHLAPIFVGPFILVPALVAVLLRRTWVNVALLILMLMVVAVPFVWDAVGAPSP